MKARLPASHGNVEPFCAPAVPADGERCPERGSELIEFTLKGTHGFSSIRPGPDCVRQRSPPGVGTGPRDSLAVQAALLPAPCFVPKGISRVSFIRNIKQRLTAAADAFNGSPDPQQRARQAAAVLPQSISTAQSRIEGARNYIGSLPVAVGPGVHQCLAGAEGNLRSAVAAQSSDPVNALAYARTAADLATRAGQMAQADVNAGMRGYGGGSWGRPGGGSGGGFARGLGAGVLGGIVGNVLFGGLFEDRNGGEGRDFDAMGGNDGFGGDGGLGGGDGGGFGGADGGGF